MIDWETPRMEEIEIWRIVVNVAKWQWIRGGVFAWCGLELWIWTSRSAHELLTWWCCYSPWINNGDGELAATSLPVECFVYNVAPWGRSTVTCELSEYVHKTASTWCCGRRWWYGKLHCGNEPRLRATEFNVICGGWYVVMQSSSALLWRQI